MSATGAIMASTSDSGIGSAARTAASATSRATTIARRAGAGALLLALLGGAAPVARLDVRIEGLRSREGVVRVCVTADPQAFPACHNDPLAARRNVPATVRALSFEGVPNGAYAMAVLHDENGNRRLDKFAGVPTEGFGFSCNPAIRFGPPRFDAARFPVAGDANVQQVRMRYML